ncbi:pantoate--beta-alanine ligase [Peribacillus sp. B-H-3]|uniref:pantoate--beta-alanine ligase n=1 Tax=Peribacillus sp. B-H-3 TaxID=3400420 RepID=UPI003B0166A4
MKIITTVREMQKHVREEKSSGKSVGFVPTMGFLHQGHRTLIENARRDNEIVVLSIFVNPLQFGPNEDLETYPRDIERDEITAREDGADYLFYPSVEEMYGSDVSVTAIVKERTDVLCGRQRPGHFDGVATVLTKLFNIVSPDRAYFGMKDAQQVAVVSSLIKDFNFDIELVPVPTVREEDGLAKSSRNVFLSDEERSQASQLYKSLQLAQKAAEAGERDPAVLSSMIRQHIESHTSGIIDYAEVYSYPALKPLDKLSGKVLIAIAVKFERARLIDNITITI